MQKKSTRKEHQDLRGKTSPAREEEKTTGEICFHYVKDRVTGVCCLVARVSQALMLNNQEAIPLQLK
jgi:hypothetical protein